MTERRKIALVAHCVLNQNAVLRGWERTQGGFTPIVTQLARENYGLVQLPCPELAYLGVDRPPQTYEDYDTESYRQHCRQLLTPLTTQVAAFLAAGYAIEVLMGIENSPSCDLRHGKGIFMEELFKLIPADALPDVGLMVPEAYTAEEPLPPTSICIYHP